MDIYYIGPCSSFDFSHGFHYCEIAYFIMCMLLFFMNTYYEHSVYEHLFLNIYHLLL